MKHLLVVAVILLAGCKAATQSGEKSYFGKDHSPYLDAPNVFIAAETEVSTDSVTLNWAEAKGADEYILKWKKSNSNTYQELARTKNPSYKVTGLQNNTSYDFKIVAKNIVGQTESNVITKSTLAGVTSPTITPQTIATMTENVQTIVNLPYTPVNNQLATSCEVTNLEGVIESQSCACDVAGTCDVGITPVTQVSGNKSFRYRILVNQNASNLETVNFWVDAVNDAPVISTFASASSPEDSSQTLNFTINDADSTLACNSSYLSLTSTNPALFNVAHVVWGGTVPNCTVTFTPVADATGSTNVAVTVSDGQTTTTSNAMTWTVTAVNDHPVMSSFPAISTNENTAKSANFTISDVDSALTCNGSVTATSSNTALVANSGIAVSGTAPNCTMTVTPELDQNGISTISVSLNDGIEVTTNTFVLTVLPVNSAPTISFLTNLSTNEDADKVINFTINDVDSVVTCSPANLSAVSSDPTVVVSTDVTFSGIYPNCSATIRPLANVYGSTNLTITLTDGALSASSNAFTLTVNAVNDAPVISPVLAQVGTQDTVKNVSFTIGDIDSVLSCHGNVTGTSSDQTIVLDSSIVISGTFPNCNAAITPAAGKSGSVDITLSLNDGTLINTNTFALVYTSVNAAPVMSALSNFSMNEDSPTTINFTISDADSTLECNSSYLSATTTNSSLVPLSGIVFGGTYPNCTATIYPVLDQSGTTSISLSVSDGLVTTTSAAITATVNAVNDVAVFSQILTQNMGLNLPAIVVMNITDVDSVIDCSTSLSGTSTNTTLVANNAIHFTGIAPACIATVNPLLDQTGVTIITITANDGSGNSSSSFTMTVGLTTTPPVAANITPASFNEDTQSLITLSYDNHNALASSCTISATNHVSVTTPCSCDVNGLCKVGVTGATNYNGAAGFSYVVTANNMVSAAATAGFTISPVNDAPAISSIVAQSTLEDTAKTVNFTISDIDNNLNCNSNVTGSSSDTSLVDNSQIVISGTAPNCVATITPSTDRNGAASITLTVNDGALSANSTFSLTVTAVNDIPVMSALGSASVNEDSSTVVNFTIADSDSIISCSGSVSATTTNASLVSLAHIVFGGTYPNCTATISPEANQHGSTTLTFSVSDGVLTDSRTLMVTVNAVNDAPVLGAIAAQAVNEDVTKNVNFTLSDVDSTLTCSGNVSATSSNTNLVASNNITISGTIPNCVASVVPTAYQSGSTSITLTATDGSLSVTSGFSLTVNAVNNAPTMSFIANDSVNEDASKVVNFTVNDVDTTILCNSTYLSAVSSNAAVVLSTDIVFGGTYPNCTATISPLADKNGTTNITLTVTDGLISTDSNAFTITVNAANDAPVISTIMAQSSDEDTVKAVNFTIGDIDSVLTCSNVSAASSDTNLVAVSGISFSGSYPNCTANITALANMNGSADLTFTVSDGSLTASTTFAYTVNQVNDAPTISSITPKTMNEDGSLVVNFTIADIDSVLTCSGRVSAVSSNTTLLTNSNVVISGTAPNCTATINPLLNKFGISTITLTVTDGSLSAGSAFSLTVNSVDDAPVATNISSATISEDVQAIITLPYADVDGDQATACSVSSLNNVTLTTPCACSSGACTAGLTGTANYNGTAGFSFTVTANSVVSNTATATFSITAVNDAPVMSAISAQTTLEDLPASVNFTISDIDSTLTCAGSVTGSSSNTTNVANAGIVITGSAPNCTATITPVANKNGTANITLTVSDGQLSTNRVFALSIQSVLDIGGSLSVTGTADINNTQLISFAGLTLDEAVSKVEVCISEDVNLNGVISAGEECNTQSWLDITTVIGASGSTTSGWLPYAIKNGKDGASFITSLAPSCSANRNYVTQIRITNSAGNSTVAVTGVWNFWTPSCISGKIGLWLDSSDASTIFSNTGCTTPSVSGVTNGVKCWVDKSTGVKYNATVKGYPKLNTSIWSGGRPSVVFDGSEDIYKAAVNLTPKNIISAVKVNVNDNFDGLIGNMGVDYGVRIDGSGNWYGTGLLGLLSNDFTYATGASAVNGVAGNNHALKEHILYQAKGDFLLSGLATTWASVGIGGYFEALGVPGRRINANVGEIIMCTTDCSSSQAKLEGYIAHKWGLTADLPAGHAYKSVAP